MTTSLLKLLGACDETAKGLVE